MAIKKIDVIEEDVLDVLKEFKGEMIATKEIAIKSGHTWRSVYERLVKLEKAGKVKGEDRGNGIYWGTKAAKKKAAPQKKEKIKGPAINENRV